MVNRLTSLTGLLQPDAPQWAQRFALRLLDTVVLKHPVAPVELWQCSKASLPPAGDWAGCVVIVSDQSELAISYGGQWLKIATAGPV
jgi:hypothetical protein